MRVTLDIEDNKFPFFIELINNLSFVKSEIDFVDDLSDARLVGGIPDTNNAK